MRRAFLALLLVLAPATLQAQDPNPPVLHLTMQDAINRALAQGEEVGLARASLDQARAQVVQARADAMPQIRTGLTYQRVFASPFQGGGNTGPTLAPFSPDTTASDAARIRYLENEYPNVLPRGLADLFRATPFGRENTWTGTLTLTQTLFQGGQVGAGLAGARAYERASEAQLRETQSDVVFRTRSAYLAAVYAQRLVQIAEGTRDLSAEQLHRVELNHRVGSSADYDLLRAQVDLANQEPAVLEARNGRDIAMLQLRQIINIPVTTPIELDADIIGTAASIPEVDYDRLSADLHARAAIASAEAAVEFRRQAVRFYRGDMWPALKLTVNMGAQMYPTGVTPNADWRRDWNASLGLSWSLFDGFRTRAQIASARADLATAQLTLAQTREAATLDVERARADLVRSRSLLEARQQTVGWATRAEHLATVRFTNGITTALEVSDARHALEQAQVYEASATRDYLLALAAMERALGTPVPIKASQLNAVNSTASENR